MKNRKLIPILPEGEPASSIPLPLHPYSYYRYPSQYENLCRHLRGEPEVVPPPVATPGFPDRPAREPLPVPAPASEGARSGDRARLHILAVDNDSRWRHALQEHLMKLGEGTAIEVAESPETALERLNARAYDLVVVDLSFRGSPLSPEEADDLGMTLVSEMRRGNLNRDAAVVILTGYATPQRARQAIRGYDVYWMLDKHTFAENDLLSTARAAILASRFERAARRVSNRYRLTVSLGLDHLTGSDLIGPETNSLSISGPPFPFDGKSFERRSDRLPLIFRGGPNAWQPEIREIGDALYRSVAADSRIAEHLAYVEELSRQGANIWIELKGPAASMGVPFEFMRSREEYLALLYTLTRRLSFPRPYISHRVGPFFAFLERLHRDGEPLRALIVAAGEEGSAAIQHEAEQVARALGESFGGIGLPCEISMLRGADARVSTVRDALMDGHFHLFHYADAPRSMDARPENGLRLRDRTLSPRELKRLLEGGELRLAYLSCALASREEGRDHLGLLDAAAEADVPAVLGFRWMVPDEMVLLCASTFYEHLARTFCPSEALLEMRRACMLEQGEQSALAPILLLQDG